MDSLVNSIRKHFTTISLSVLIVLILINVTLTVYNRSVMITNNTLKAQTEEVKLRLNNIFESILRRIDLGLRGYALTKNPQLLDPYEGAIRENIVNLRKLDSLFTVQKLDTTVAQFTPIKFGINAYVEHSRKMKALAERDSLAEFVRLLNQDKGYDLWKLFSPFYTRTIHYEDTLVKKALDDYSAAQNRNVIFQVMLIIVSVPTLLLLIRRLRSEDKNRKALIQDFEKSNRKFLFDSGGTLDGDNAHAIIDDSIQNLKKASVFVKDIATGNYQVRWQGLTKENEPLNRENLVGDLLRMRDEMRKIKKNDDIRLWSTEGLSQFSEIIRNHQDNKEKLSNEIVRFLTKYISAQQSSLFVVKSDVDESIYLELAACYAFDKRKYLEKRIDPGTGLIGQAYLEGDTILLSELPNGYVHITSGLGDATPRFLIIVPMKYNGKVEAILELATFHTFEPHQVAFLEKAGEFVASAMFAANTSEQTSKLLRQSQEQAEVLRAQEEELRQNMEEMQATQEELVRKEREMRLDAGRG